MAREELQRVVTMVGGGEVTLQRNVVLVTEQQRKDRFNEGFRLENVKLDLGQLEKVGV